MGDGGVVAAEDGGLVVPVGRQLLPSTLESARHIIKVQGQILAPGLLLQSSDGCQQARGEKVGASDPPQSPCKLINFFLATKKNTTQLDHTCNIRALV